MRPRKQNKERREEGYVLVVVAILLIALVGFTALAVDAGVFYSTRTSAQKIADAASLAGVFTFVLNPADEQPAAAEAAALAVATEQAIRDDPILASEVAVAVDVPNRRVQVTITRDESTFFGRVLGITNSDVGARATAEAAQNAVGANCVRPWILPNTVLLPDGSNPCDACPESPNYDPELASQLLVSNGTVTEFAKAQLTEQISVRPTRPQDALEPAQFYSIQLGDGSGAAVYRENIATCAPEGVFCSACYDVETGNMVGPTKQGVEDLIGDPPDTFNETNICYDPGCRDTSQALVVAPIWDICNTPDPDGCPAADFCPGGKLSDPGGTAVLRVAGFAMLFVEGMSGNDVVARLMNVSACEAGGGGAGGGEGGEAGPQTGPFGIPVRLIQNN